jgi:hypothetical protein
MAVIPNCSQYCQLSLNRFIFRDKFCASTGAKTKNLHIMYIKRDKFLQTICIELEVISNGITKRAEPVEKYEI